jgi:hypothetical protein
MSSAQNASTGTRHGQRGGPGPGAAILAFVVLLAIAAGVHTLAQRRDQTGGAAAGTAGSGPGIFPIVSTVDKGDTLEVVAIAGGTEVDFTAADLAAGGGRLDAVVLFGNLEIKVPRGWSVVRDNEMIFSRFEDRIEPAGGGTPKRLILDGVVLFGAIEVTH